MEQKIKDKFAWAKCQDNLSREDMLDQLQDDIIGLVEQLKADITDLYHKIGKAEVWRASNDVVCDLCEEYIKKKIEE